MTYYIPQSVLLQQRWKRLTGIRLTEPLFQAIIYATSFGSQGW